MKQNNVPCEIIVDMMPLYNEGICSEESKKMIEEHMENCSSCKKLCETVPVASAKSDTAPEEAETFRKVSRKIKYAKWKNWILGAMLTAAVLIFAALSAEQIMKIDERGLQSFETVFQSAETRKLAGYLGRGEIEKFMECVSMDDIYSSVDRLMEETEIRDQEIQKIKESYDKVYGGKKANNIDVHSYYSDIYGVGSVIAVSEAKITFTDGTMLEFELHKGADGLYIVSLINDYNTNEFSKCMNYIFWHGMPTESFYEDGIIRFGSMSEREKSVFIDSFSEIFSSEYTEKVRAGMEKFYSGNYKVTSCEFSDVHWDKEQKMIYYNLIIQASDSKGKAVMQTRVYNRMDGLVPPENSEYEVFSDGCSEELLDALGTFLG